MSGAFQNYASPGEAGGGEPPEENPAVSLGALYNSITAMAVTHDINSFNTVPASSVSQTLYDIGWDGRKVGGDWVVVAEMEDVVAILQMAFVVMQISVYQTVSTDKKLLDETYYKPTASDRIPGTPLGAGADIYFATASSATGTASTTSHTMGVVKTARAEFVPQGFFKKIDLIINGKGQDWQGHQYQHIESWFNSQVNSKSWQNKWGMGVYTEKTLNCHYSYGKDWRDDNAAYIARNTFFSLGAEGGTGVRYLPLRLMHPYFMQQTDRLTLGVRMKLTFTINDPKWWIIRRDPIAHYTNKKEANYEVSTLDFRMPHAGNYPVVAALSSILSDKATFFRTMVDNGIELKWFTWNLALDDFELSDKNTKINLKINVSQLPRKVIISVKRKPKIATDDNYTEHPYLGGAIQSFKLTGKMGSRNIRIFTAEDDVSFKDRKQVMEMWYNYSKLMGGSYSTQSQLEYGTDFYTWYTLVRDIVVPLYDDNVWLQTCSISRGAYPQIELNFTPTAYEYNYGKATTALYDPSGDATTSDDIPRWAKGDLMGYTMVLFNAGDVIINTSAPGVHGQLAYTNNYAQYPDGEVSESILAGGNPTGALYDRAFASARGTVP